MGYTFLPEEVHYETLLYIWIAAVTLVVIQFISGCYLGWITSCQINKVTEEGDESGWVVEKSLYDTIERIIWFNDYIFEIIVVVCNVILFYYTDFETKGGFVLAIISSLLNWINACNDLNEYHKLYAYTQIPINLEKSIK